jgi:hypothetical protein
MKKMSVPIILHEVFSTLSGQTREHGCTYSDGTKPVLVEWGTGYLARPFQRQDERPHDPDRLKTVVEAPEGKYLFVAEHIDEIQTLVMAQMQKFGPK